MNVLKGIVEDGGIIDISGEGAEKKWEILSAEAPVNQALNSKLIDTMTFMQGLNTLLYTSNLRKTSASKVA